MGKIVVAGMPRCGSTLLARAIAGLSPGSTWPKHYRGRVLKIHRALPGDLDRRVDRAIFLHGDIVKSVISTRLRRFGSGHLRNCGCTKPLSEVDLFHRDDLNYEAMFDWWISSSHEFPLMLIRYETLYSHIEEISSFLGFRVKLPPWKKRKTAYSDVFKEDLAAIQKTYEQLIRKQRALADIEYRGGL